MAFVMQAQQRASGSRALATAAVVALVLAVALVSLPARAVAGADALIQVIVQEVSGAGNAPEAAVRSMGGSVDRRLDLIGGFTARIPANRLAQLQATRGVRAATPDAALRLLGGGDPRDGDGRAATGNTMRHVVEAIQADDMWNDGHTGEGVDVALIDSGVVPVDGLTYPGKVINGPDLSFDSQDPDRIYLDGYGHGTHMAGIIAGRDDALDDGSLLEDLLDIIFGDGDDELFAGVAPGARILNVKVGASNGAADVSQVIAAIDWVVQHRTDNGLNVRVLNLSFGTSGTQHYLLDPLAHAAEVAWHAGIVVVVAGGNDGFGTIKLNNPAYDPYVIAVSASDTHGTDSISDDTIPAFSSTGDYVRHPDFAAPGKSIVGLRAPGSAIDRANPGARVGERFFRGSGTSQAAAVVSGAVALLLDARPTLTPDQVKSMLTRGARPLDRANTLAEGAGAIDVKRALGTTVPVGYAQAHRRSTGTGSLELARGLSHVSMDGVELTGEQDIFGRKWNGEAWAARCTAETSWVGGWWRGSSWTGSSWTGSSWTGSSWTGSSWTGSSWTGSSWTGSSWTGSSWTSKMWAGAGWGS